VRRQILGRRLAGAPGNPDDGPPPRLEDAVGEHLQGFDHVRDEEEAPPQRLQLGVARDALGARDGRQRAALEGLRDEAVRVRKRRAREPVARVVLRREGEEEFALCDGARVDGETRDLLFQYFLVK
jgi:hypothetical protein